MECSPCQSMGPPHVSEQGTLGLWMQGFLQCWSGRHLFQKTHCSLPGQLSSPATVLSYTNNLWCFTVNFNGTKTNQITWSKLHWEIILKSIKGKFDRKYSILLFNFLLECEESVLPYPYLPRVSPEQVARLDIPVDYVMIVHCNTGHISIILVGLHSFYF